MNLCTLCFYGAKRNEKTFCFFLYVLRDDSQVPLLGSTPTHARTPSCKRTRVHFQAKYLENMYAHNYILWPCVGGSMRVSVCVFYKLRQLKELPSKNTEKKAKTH